MQKLVNPIVRRSETKMWMRENSSTGNPGTVADAPGAGTATRTGAMASTDNMDDRIAPTTGAAAVARRDSTWTDEMLDSNNLNAGIEEEDHTENE